MWKTLPRFDIVLLLSSHIAVFFCFPDGSTKVRFADTYVEIIEEDLDERSSENDDPSNGEEPRFIEIFTFPIFLKRGKDVVSSRISQIEKRKSDRFWVAGSLENDAK